MLKVTKFSVIDWSSISNINRLVGIDCYRLILIIIDYDFIGWSRRDFCNTGSFHENPPQNHCNVHGHLKLAFQRRFLCMWNSSVHTSSYPKLKLKLKFLRHWFVYVCWTLALETHYRKTKSQLLEFLYFSSQILFFSCLNVLWRGLRAGMDIDYLL